MSVISEYRAVGAGLWSLDGELLGVLDCAAVDVVSLLLVIRPILMSSPASTVDQASALAEAEREFLAEVSRPEPDVASSRAVTDQHGIG